jgi:hypothetical protein
MVSFLKIMPNADRAGPSLRRSPTEFTGFSKGDGTCNRNEGVLFDAVFVAIYLRHYLP